MNFTYIGEREINIWIPDKIMCIKYGNLTTMKYLSSINYPICDDGNACQYCKLS